MVKNRKIYKNEIFVTICFVIFTLMISFLLYVYMGLPLKASMTDYQFTDSQNHVDKIEYENDAINIEGWFFVENQESNRQLKRKLVLSNEQSDRTYAYPLQYIKRPDVVKAFPKAFTNDKWTPRPGYSTQVNTSFIGPGTYKLYLSYTYNDKKFIFDLNKEVVLK